MILGVIPFTLFYYEESGDGCSAHARAAPRRAAPLRLRAQPEATAHG